MSAGAEPNAPNPPPAPRPAAATNSALKLAVPLAALVAVVFGVTYITQYTPHEPDADRKEAGAAATGEPVLRVFTSARRWDPPLLTPKLGYRHHPLIAPSAVAPEGRFTIQDRVFQGFYERSADLQRATQFWFENRNPTPVTMQLLDVSCGACTGGRVAAVPPDVARSVLQHAALAALPVGAFNPFGVALTQPHAELVRPGALAWTEHSFNVPPAERARVTYRVPAAPANPDKWAPQWNILELRFKVTGQPGETPKPLKVTFATKADGSEQQDAYDFLIGFEVAQAFALSRAAIDADKITPQTGERTYDLLLYSATRGPGSEFGDLEVPSSAVEAPPGVADAAKFVEVTKVERVPEDELADVAELLSRTRRTHVRSAYRVAVTVRPVVGDARMDIGKFERTVAFAAGGATAQLPVKARVTGPVRLDDDGTDVELAPFPGGRGTVQTFDLTTAAAALELAVLEGECVSDGLKFELERQPPRDEQGRYKLKVSVPPGKIFGPTRGVVVLQVKGASPQRMRIPFKGTGTN